MPNNNLIILPIGIYYSYIFSNRCSAMGQQYTYTTYTIRPYFILLDFFSFISSSFDLLLLFYLIIHLGQCPSIFYDLQLLVWSYLCPTAKYPLSYAEIYCPSAQSASLCCCDLRFLAYNELNFVQISSAMSVCFY